MGIGIAIAVILLALIILLVALIGLAACMLSSDISREEE